MIVSTEKPTAEVIAEMIENLDSHSRELLCDYFRDIASKEVLAEHPLPALADQERVELDAFLKQGLL